MLRKLRQSWRPHRGSYYSGEESPNCGDGAGRPVPGLTGCWTRRPTPQGTVLDNVKAEQPGRKLSGQADGKCNRKIPLRRWAVGGIPWAEKSRYGPLFYLLHTAYRLPPSKGEMVR